MISKTQSAVSVLIPAYNVACFLQSALASIAAQSTDDWELIVVEDGTDDGTRALVSEFATRHQKHRIVYDRFQNHRGVAAARNRLLDLCQGEIVAFLDADDQWEPEHLFNLKKKLGEGHVLACSPIRIWDGVSGKQLRVYEPTPAQLDHPCLGLFKSSFIQTSSCVAIPRITIERVGRFDESLKIGEDRDYWFRVLLGGGTLGCTSSPTCRYFKHPGNSMAKTIVVAEQTVQFYEKHRDSNCLPKWLARRCLADALRTHGRLYRREDAKVARKMFLRAWKMWPLGLDLPIRACSACCLKSKWRREVKKE